ncbi:glutathionylspermidine synthase family protein [Thermoactinomyces sp. CICC 10735]|uniref:glutathionylspermidine synthase family protein n=1 Tax=Thermoactinomyces sp. CICC 10735 TaxID=2767430 RepID=UPI0018DBABAB|nr:glutathionylspermidine synthase family protein [Thermoactinomyces sp. CICC 10735]MBH8583528.1 glutathionylspermidine synthase family protein [Thermoactinomyces sp. CICC 10735]
MKDLNYAKRREQIYHLLREEKVFTWDVMYGQEYALASVYPLDPALHHEIQQATACLGKIYERTVKVLQQADDRLLEELGIPEAARRAVRQPFLLDWPTVIGRFDFAYTPQGLKMLEFNSDTPTGIVEAFYVNGRVTKAMGYQDPNEGMEQDLTDAFQNVVEAYQKRGFRTDHICFSALDWHEEDSGTTQYLMEKSGLCARFVPLSALAVRGDRLYAKQDHAGYGPVDVLYRLHAIEIMAEDTDEDGYPTGAHLLSLMAGQKLVSINPPSALLSQTKALQALIWNLYETNTFFNEEERDVIATYMLPTYLENNFKGHAAYVKKPFFGREGGAVSLYDQNGNLIVRDNQDAYWDQPMIYQQLVSLQKVEVETLKGAYQGELLWGSFLIGGKPSAVIARVDRKITGNLSYFVPVGRKD